MSRKFTIFRFVLIVIDSPSSLNCFVMFFLILSACGPEMFSYAARPSSRYSPIFPLIMAFSDNLFSMYRPTSSHISAPSYDPIVTSNKLWLALLVHAVSPSKRRDFLACIIIFISFCGMSIKLFANSMAFFSRLSVIDG